MMAAEELSERVGTKAACNALSIPRSTYYRRNDVPSSAPRPSPPRALTYGEREHVRTVLTSEEYQDSSVRSVYTSLLDKGMYLCSVSTMHRSLREEDMVHERRNQLVHPAYQRPELLATGPNQVWSWDITKMRGPATWTYYYLYVIMDIFSRFVVGWTLARRESGELAKELMLASCDRQQVDKNALILHSDRGSAMTSHSLAELLVNLGVAKTHSRPHVSNDNPYSEAQFKTMKYRPDYPSRFGCIQDGRQWARDFFDWYNYDHYHSGLAYMTPSHVHYGMASDVAAARQRALDAAHALHPERFVQGRPQVAIPDTEAWINKPKSEEERARAMENQIRILTPGPQPEARTTSDPMLH